jgi:long-chain acyl-CoA synthetase
MGSSAWGTTRSLVDFSDQLPRLPTGKPDKPDKRRLRDAFWAGHESRLV